MSGGGGGAFNPPPSKFPTEKHSGIHHDTSEIQVFQYRFLYKFSANLNVFFLFYQKPVYDVDRQHQFPPEAPVRKEAAGHEDLRRVPIFSLIHFKLNFKIISNICRFPVYDVETQHSFQDKAPAHHETKCEKKFSYLLY